jgi:sigma-B regulation protein RsbU (phosphoserine phosphatase)
MSKQPGFFKDFFGTIRQDLKQTNLKSSVSKDLRSIYEFYLSPSERAKLDAMGWFRRWLYRVLWFLKNIFNKLTAIRRLLVLFAAILAFSYDDTSKMSLGFLILFAVLLLELKDKLLAHDELAAGRAVQEALRPESCPALHGWDTWFFSRSANEVGGDLVDCIEFDDDRFAFVLGDVSGKGLGAALLMAQLQASVQALAPSTKSNSQLVSRLNELYCRGGLSSSFISFIYLDVKPDSGKISFVNAGHLPPVVVRQGELQEWTKGSVALGLEKNAKFKEEQITLQHDDFLIVFTDGVTEARNSDGDFWGEERFYQLLPKLQSLTSEDMGEKILQAVDDFAGDAIRNDDLTFLILKRA